MINQFPPFLKQILPFLKNDSRRKIIAKIGKSPIDGFQQQCQNQIIESEL
jgi:hypothetical protein